MALFYPHVSVSGGWLTGFTEDAKRLFPDLFQSPGTPADWITRFPALGPERGLFLVSFHSQGSFHSPRCRPFPLGAIISIYFTCLLCFIGVLAKCGLIFWLRDYYFFFSLSSSSANRPVCLQFWKKALIPLQLTAISPFLFMVLYQKLFCKVVYIWQRLSSLSPQPHSNKIFAFSTALKLLCQGHRGMQATTPNSHLSVLSTWALSGAGPGQRSRLCDSLSPLGS